MPVTEARSESVGSSRREPRAPAKASKTAASPRPTLDVLSVCSEIYPLIKTGGLADVTGALPAALAQEGVQLCSLVPGYPAVTAALTKAATVHSFAYLHGGAARLLRGRAAGLELLVLDAPHLYARAGNPYVDAEGRDWPDNALRFSALAEAAVAVARGAVADYLPDVVQAHDWQAGLVPALLHYRGGARPATVMTVHNMSFQGQFPSWLLATLGLPPYAYAIEGVEYYGSIGYLKAGLLFADRITTVSPTYAAEITTVEGGMGLGGLLHGRSNALTGILNGIDEAIWNPAKDSLLTAPFDAKHLGRRLKNKTALQARLGLTPEPQTLLYGVVSRLAYQKGMDLLVQALPALGAGGAHRAQGGSGDLARESAVRAAAAQHPGRVAAVLDYDEPLAHAMQGGVDALLVPSRFEPCGLTQLCALRYGAIPVVARVGGLADTVIDANAMALAAGVGTGVQFAPVDLKSFELALAYTARLWRDPVQWRRLQTRAMATDVSWSHPARQYAALFRDLVAARAA